MDGRLCTPGYTPKCIIYDLGMFDSELNPLKRQARKGQLFATSHFITSDFQIQKIPDIKKLSALVDESTGVEVE